MPGVQRLQIAEAAGTLSGAQLQKMFAAFMLTQNAALAGPRREDSYSGSVVKIKVPIASMSDTDQPQIRAGATPWRSPTLQARVAATTLTCKGPERQRLAGPQSKMPLGFLQQGPLTSRLRGGGEEPEKDAEIDAEAVSKGTGEPHETTPEPKSQQAQSRGYKSCQARKMDLQVADRRDQRLMRCCGLMKVVWGNQNPP
jgi:hypothetical protein